MAGESESSRVGAMSNCSRRKPSRWRRSDAKFPASLAVEARADFERRIEGHPQFRRSVG